MGMLLHSCAEACEPIELPFGEMSGVGPGIHVLDGDHVPQGEGVDFRSFAPLIQWFQWRIL